ncbi:VWA domain-containing protein [Lentzea jiangxiensis]|uniref:von Willebrand factor type A domain-containing protein n=1 Tax=Lentzea jiangxiensis TaxID=641025 RepID=A0A1H0S4X5_9PSEU|nr:VWA domain-containing protein [Lentzea jiangxiensis]SDP36599.1 von Willebrand factor type A domain-containing protein [Lentzea jiangxiensis]
MNLAWLLVPIAVALAVVVVVVLLRRKSARRERDWWDSGPAVADAGKSGIGGVSAPAEDDVPTLELPPVVRYGTLPGYDQGVPPSPVNVDEPLVGYGQPATVSTHGTDPDYEPDECDVPPMSRPQPDDRDVFTARGLEPAAQVIRPISAEAPGWPRFVVPFDDDRGPLPRNGLYVRRNNAFGTKATAGIADLVDQGVLIDQTQVRFDDFVASNLTGIPSPPPGEALAVSHGVAAAGEDFRARPDTTHFVELALRAGDIPRRAPRESMPVNFVFVVDTSASMEGSKLRTVKTAIRELYAQLRETDVLGIVTFDTRVRTVLKATPKAEIPPRLLEDVVTELKADGGTDINMGVLFGVDEIARHSGGRPDLVNCLYLFSDGDPTSGERDWISIRRTVAERVRGDITLSCFGFGEDARLRELEALAGVTGGFCTLVTDPDDVRLHLAEDLTRREHLAAINVQLRLRLDESVTAWHLYGHDLVTDPSTRARVEREVATAKHRARDDFGVESLPDLVTGDEGIRIFAPDLAEGETYWVVLEVEAPDGTTDFGRATVQYVDVVARDTRRHELELTDGAIAPETVFAHAVGLHTSEVVFHALEDLYQEDREAARRRLADHVETLRAAHTVSPSPQFHSDQVTVRKLTSLVHNVGLVQAWSDRGEGAFTIFTLNRMGRSRSGFARRKFD